MERGSKKNCAELVKLIVNIVAFSTANSQLASQRRATRHPSRDVIEGKRHFRVGQHHQLRPDGDAQEGVGAGETSGDHHGL